MKMRPVAITGIGCLCAAGLTLRQCMDSLYAGKRQPAAPTRFPFKHKLSFPVFEIEQDFFPEDRISNGKLLRTSKLALTATLGALDDAGLTIENLRQLKTGVCIGTNVGSSMNNEAFYRDNTEGCDPYVAPADRFLMSNPTNSIAAEFGISGPCLTVVNACSAGSDALGIAASWIKSGLCDAVIAGGADELYRVTYTGFKSLFINADSPCKPFDAERNGLNLGEGAAMFVLVSEGMLRKKGLSPRAFVLGYGSASDAYHFTKPRPDGKGLMLAIQEALKTSGLISSDLAFVNAHGTGTRDNDLIESRVLDEILPGIPFLSTKGYTGHTLGASGAIEAAFTIACLENGQIPASIGFKTPDPELPASPVEINTEISGRAALSETLAFGGNNAVLVLGTGEGNI
ncbi:MAG: beta-ketoacyl-[acyl-carrier-protein] synthase family protein [Deltaproteobacteria bacterium]|nr:beta-ketoacyl-[acyl-carrier-protein] synthase family protein [Deltaproteobacteria bacterium]